MIFWQSKFDYPTYSGGQKRRVSFGTALMGGPDLLVLDEPTVGTDPVLRYVHTCTGDGAVRENIKISDWIKRFLPPLVVDITTKETTPNDVAPYFEVGIYKEKNRKKTRSPSRKSLGIYIYIWSLGNQFGSAYVYWHLRGEPSCLQRTMLRYDNNTYIQK